MTCERKCRVPEVVALALDVAVVKLKQRPVVCAWMPDKRAVEETEEIKLRVGAAQRDTSEYILFLILVTVRQKLTLQTTLLKFSIVVGIVVAPVAAGKIKRD